MYTKIFGKKNGYSSEYLCYILGPPMQQGLNLQGDKCLAAGRSDSLEGAEDVLDLAVHLLELSTRQLLV